MDTEQRDALRERNKRRGNCAKCGGTPRELTAAEKARRDDVFVERRYMECGSCGNTWTVKGTPVKGY